MNLEKIKSNNVTKRIGLFALGFYILYFKAMKVEDFNFITSSPGYGKVVFWALLVIIIPLSINTLVLSVIIMLGFFYKTEYVGTMIFVSLSAIVFKYFRDKN